MSKNTKKTSDKDMENVTGGVTGNAEARPDALSSLEEFTKQSNEFYTKRGVPIPAGKPSALSSLSEFKKQSAEFFSRHEAQNKPQSK